VLTAVWLWSGAGAEGQPPLVGIVDRVSGPWTFVSTDQPIHVRDPVPANEAIATRKADDSSITVYLVATGKPWTVTCTTTAKCEQTYTPPSPAAPKTGPWAFLASFKISEPLLKQVLPAGRGVTSSGPDHTLLVRTGGAVDLRPALAHVMQGNYQLTLVPVKESVPTSSAIERTIRVAPNVDLTVRPVDAGLYTLSLTDESGTALGSPAVVLAIDDRDEQAKAMWSELVAQTRQWDAANAGTIDAARVRMLLALDERRNQVGRLTWGLVRALRASTGGGS